MRAAVIGMVCVFAVSVIACGGGKQTEKHEAEKREPEKKVYSREEFTKLVEGKTPDEVIKAVGKPDSTQENVGHINWYYKNCTKDPVTGKVDWLTQVSFENGVVDRINY